MEIIVVDRNDDTHRRRCRPSSSMETMIPIAPNAGGRKGRPYVNLIG
jgi:hypothetical protein